MRIKNFKFAKLIEKIKNRSIQLYTKVYELLIFIPNSFIRRHLRTVNHFLFHQLTNFIISIFSKITQQLNEA